ncbi:Hpt domain-containing protein [Arthrobacter sp. NPDC093125]|uniref:Hpt domain-containing protein n=1 Tax=Arthrobacter sp. NPDC093125 TaxID=3363944 RepID=UPI003828127D
MSTSGSSTGDGGAQGVCLPEAGATDDEPEQPQGLPILDLKVLQELAEDMGGSGVARAFAKDYIGIWDKRQGYLEQSVRNNDSELAMDAVLSLKNSAFMVGGLQLASLAVELERLIRAGDLPAVRSLLPVVAQTGHDTVTALKKTYLRHGR